MTESRMPFRPDLEALRGAAVLLVVAYHAAVPALAGGFVGVDVFFVLSGYFAASLLAREYAASGTVDVPRFWARRARRLLPALLVVVAVTLAITWLLWAPIDRADVAASAREVALGRANLGFAERELDYFGGGTRSPFLHTWSLAVEQQLSLALPLLFLALTAVGAWSAGRGRDATDTPTEANRRAGGLLRGAGLGFVLAAMASLAAAILQTRSEPAWAFYGPASRAWEFLAGGVLALALPVPDAARAGDAAARRGWWLQLAGLAAIVVAALTFDQTMPWPGTGVLLPVAGTLAVIAGGMHGRGVLAGDGAALRGLRELGRLSYAWYLWHWLFVVTAVLLVPGIGATGRVLWSVAALLPAWLTMRWVEQPARARGGEAAADREWLFGALATCALVALGATMLHEAARRRVRTPDQRAFALARADRMQRHCWDVDPAALPASCTFGDPRGTRTVVLFGDSHAEHWLAALDQLGKERGWRVVPMVKGGCPVSDAPDLAAGRNARRGAECARYRDAAIRRLAAMRPDLVVLSSWSEYVRRAEGTPGDEWRISAAAWQRGLERTYARIGAAGVPMVVIRGTPRTGFDVPACLSRRADGRPFAASCTWERREGLHAAARAAQAAAVREARRRAIPVAAVEMSDLVCATARCGVVRGGVVVFTDDNHLTASFTRAAAPVLGRRMDGALASLGRRLP